MTALTSMLSWLLLAAPVEAADELAGIEVENTQLSLYAQGRRLSGDGLVGVELDIPELGTLRIDAVALDPDSRFGDIWLYQAQLRLPGSDGFEPFCEPDEQGDTRLLLFAGGFDAAMRYREDASRFSLSCVSGVQAKCLRWGYAPWRLAPDTGIAMTEHYNACLHLARADYCGDDRPSTRDGTLIDIYDRVGVQAPEDDPGELVFEAGWNADGAVCVHHTRIAQHLDLETLARDCPRLAASLGEDCTEAAAIERGAVLFNRSRDDRVALE